MGNNTFVFQDIFSLIFMMFASTSTAVVMFNNWYSLLAMKVLSLSPFDFPFVAWIIKSCRRHLFTGWLSTKPQLKKSTSRTLILASILCGQIPFSWQICFLWSHQCPISEDAFCSCLRKVPPSVFDTASCAKISYLWFLEFRRARRQKMICVHEYIFSVWQVTPYSYWKDAHPHQTKPKKLKREQLMFPCHQRTFTNPEDQVSVLSLFVCVCVCVCFLRACS